MKNETDNTKRFSNRVEDYIKYRPHYPKELTELLKKEIGLESHNIIADVGSGTGISSKLFLENGNLVYGVEPNDSMRTAQEYLLSSENNFISVNGTGEQTTLENNSIDVIFCGQAFHWLDKPKSKIEFQRILKPDGKIVLVWNQRSLQSQFQQAYDKVLFECVPAYRNIKHRNSDNQEIAEFFDPASMKKVVLSNQQEFDLNSLIGRLQSSSYCPKSGAAHQRLMQQIELLFMKYQKNNKITFEYDTNVYWSV